MKRDPIGAGQESVWDYPRPPRLERSSRLVRVVFAGREVARSSRTHRVLETSHPPVYYIPPDDVVDGILVPAGGGSICEWKGRAAYWSLRVGEKEAPEAAWSYPTPTPAFTAIRDHLAFYPGRVDACYVDDERVRPQPGGFYGGWITSDVVGPFKGAAGTMGW